MALTISFPPVPPEEQQAFNLKRWAELGADRELATLEARIETDRFGHIVMTPPPAPRHGSYQSEIAGLLRNMQSDGRVLTECPISTSDGVKAADVVWISKDRLTPMEDAACFTQAPELCVEVISPSNTPAEMEEKKALYFQAGADEVWFCSVAGAMTFYSAGGALARSLRCPNFPVQVELR